jgi:sirohydrochlorin cobaltochelatase
MNCQMCKYREQVLGFEEDIGRAQESHHHHVEGLGAEAECQLCDVTCTGACEAQPREHHHHHHHGDGHHHHDHGDGHHHHHDHHHPVYPHADHPLGPKSMRRDG